MPSLRKFTSSCVCVPPYSVLAATISSPASQMFSIAIICAAIPLEVATAARPFSNAAMRSSKTATVGFDKREYTLPKVCRLNKLAACSALSKT